jgi:NAD(P)-dependent dehydrogenase (short-subunit alcohol dehydrogenase family)
LVTGASRGIGLAVVRTLVDEGARVVAAARDVGGELADLPEEVGALVAFLAGGRVGDLTGADIIIDGGLDPVM